MRRSPPTWLEQTVDRRHQKVGYRARVLGKVCTGKNWTWNAGAASSIVKPPSRGFPFSVRFSLFSYLFIRSCVRGDFRLFWRARCNVSSSWPNALVSSFKLFFVSCLEFSLRVYYLLHIYVESGITELLSSISSSKHRTYFYRVSIDRAFEI